MKEVTELYTVGSIYDKETKSYAARKINSLGIFVVIDNEDEYRKNFAETNEVDIWKQKLSQQVLSEYENKKDFLSVQEVKCKAEYYLFFSLEKVGLGIANGGCVIVVHYKFHLNRPLLY